LLACLVVFSALSVVSVFGQSRQYRPPAHYVQIGKPDQAEGRKILEEFRTKGISGDYYLEFLLRVLPRRGDERVVPGRMWGGRNDLGPVSRVILQPGVTGAERRLLVQNGPQSAVWAWPDAAGQVAPLGSAALFTPLADTDLTAFDLQMPFIYWNDFVFEGVEPVRGRPAHVFLLYPPAGISAQKPDLAGVRVYLDTQFGALVQAQQIGNDNQTLKSITVLDLKKVDSQWIVKTIDVRDEKTRNKTQFTITGAALDLDFSGGLFEPGALPDSITPPVASRIRQIGQ
jgi:hypothetical protein